jgi:hypothetical protein
MYIIQRKEYKVLEKTEEIATKFQMNELKCTAVYMIHATRPCMICAGMMKKSVFYHSHIQYSCKNTAITRPQRGKRSVKPTMANKGKVVTVL